MNQACVHNDTIDAGNHHGRPQYRHGPVDLVPQHVGEDWYLN